MIRVLLGLLFVTQAGQAQEFVEPKWCQPQEFFKHEVQPKVKGKMPRLRMFRVEGVTLVGVAVGKSDHVALQRLHDAETEGEQDPKYCTWYLNKGNKTAERVFNHKYMSKPSSKADKAAREWVAGLGPIFFDNNPSAIKKCIEKNKYVAMGCQGHKHRGPTGWGMMLSYLGCSPENAERITRTMWGLNGIKASSRVAINKEGKKIGDAYRKVLATIAMAKLQIGMEGENSLGPILPNTYSNPLFIPTNFLPTSAWPNGVLPTLDPPSPIVESKPKPKPKPAEEETDTVVRNPLVQNQNGQTTGYGDQSTSGYSPQSGRRPANTYSGYGDNNDSTGYGGSNQQGY